MASGGGPSTAHAPHEIDEEGYDRRQLFELESDEDADDRFAVEGAAGERMRREDLRPEVSPSPEASSDEGGGGGAPSGAGAPGEAASARDRDALLRSRRGLPDAFARVERVLERTEVLAHARAQQRNRRKPPPSSEPGGAPVRPARQARDPAGGLLRSALRGVVKQRGAEAGRAGGDGPGGGDGGAGSSEGAGAKRVRFAAGVPEGRGVSKRRKGIMDSMRAR